MKLPGIFDQITSRILRRKQGKQENSHYEAGDLDPAYDVEAGHCDLINNANYVTAVPLPGGDVPAQYVELRAMMQTSRPYHGGLSHASDDSLFSALDTGGRDPNAAAGLPSVGTFVIRSPGSAAHLGALFDGTYVNLSVFYSQERAAALFSGPLKAESIIKSVSVVIQGPDWTEHVVEEYAGYALDMVASVRSQSPVYVKNHGKTVEMLLPLTVLGASFPMSAFRNHCISVRVLFHHRVDDALLRARYVSGGGSRREPLQAVASRRFTAADSRRGRMTIPLGDMPFGRFPYYEMLISVMLTDEDSEEVPCEVQSISIFGDGRLLFRAPGMVCRTIVPVNALGACPLPPGLYVLPLGAGRRDPSHGALVVDCFTSLDLVLELPSGAYDVKLVWKYIKSL
jgi:hypothetical protein